MRHRSWHPVLHNQQSLKDLGKASSEDSLPSIMLANMSASPLLSRTSFVLLQSWITVRKALLAQCWQNTAETAPPQRRLFECSSQP